MSDDITNFPLSWPLKQERTSPQDRKRANFTTRSRGFSYRADRKHSIAESAKALEAEIRRMGGENMIISSNLRVKSDGFPYSNQRDPEDPGVAVYFNWKEAQPVFACDRFLDIKDNLWAIVKHIEAMRGQDRWGVGTLDQAFAGYIQLNDPNTLQWWEVLHVSKMADDDTIKRARLILARQYHPDTGVNGGDSVMFDQVQKAFEQAIPKERLK